VSDLKSVACGNAVGVRALLSPLHFLIDRKVPYNKVTLIKKEDVKMIIFFILFFILFTFSNKTYWASKFVYALFVTVCLMTLPAVILTPLIIALTIAKIACIVTLGYILGSFIDYVITESKKTS
jgi:hypothetical protein